MDYSLSSVHHFSDTVEISYTKSTKSCWAIPVFSHTDLQGGFLLTGRVHGSVFHCNRCATYCKAHVRFADESEWLTGDNVWNEIVNSSHITGRFANAVLATCTCIYFSQLIVSLNHRYNNPSCTYSTPDTNFHWVASSIVLPFLQ